MAIAISSSNLDFASRQIASPMRFLCLTALLRIAEQSAGPIRVDQDDLPAILKAQSKKSPCAQGRVACQNSQMIKSALAYIA